VRQPLVDDAGDELDRVRQEALRADAPPLAAAFVAERLDGEVDRRPPARIRRAVAQHRGDFVDRPENAPTVDVAIHRRLRDRDRAQRDGEECDGADRDGDVAGRTLHASRTRSARASTAAGTCRPIRCAVLRLTTSSRIVGCSMGSEDGARP
jgi:hypothetical protein